MQPAAFLSHCSVIRSTLQSQAVVPSGCRQPPHGLSQIPWCGGWREAHLMMVIMLALSWGVVFICWLELRIAWSVSGSARSDAERL